MEAWKAFWPSCFILNQGSDPMEDCEAPPRPKAHCKHTATRPRGARSGGKRTEMKSGSQVDESTGRWNITVRDFLRSFDYLFVRSGSITKRPNGSFPANTQPLERSRGGEKQWRNTWRKSSNPGKASPKSCKAPQKFFQMYFQPAMWKGLQKWSLLTLSVDFFQIEKLISLPICSFRSHSCLRGHKILPGTWTIKFQYFLLGTRKATTNWVTRH